MRRRKLEVLVISMCNSLDRVNTLKHEAGHSLTRENLIPNGINPQHGWRKHTVLCFTTSDKTNSAVSFLAAVMLGRYIFQSCCG